MGNTTRETVADLVPLMDAAAQLGLSYQTTRDRALRGELPGFVRIGRSLFIKQSELEAYARKRKQDRKSKND